MASPQQGSGSKRPRLSLQTKSPSAATARVVKAYSINPSDPTTFNTLSNAYVTAIERSCSMLSEPITAINTLQAFTLDTPVDPKSAKPRVVTPYVTRFSGTALTAVPVSPSELHLPLPSTMTATPPLSAEISEPATPSIFTFSSVDVALTRGRDVLGISDATRFRSVAAPVLPAELGSHPPYSHPRSLHSILRNSPLPPRTAIPPPSPRRQSLRLQEKAAKRVGYNSPLTQEIVTNKYTKSHIELLSEEASPSSPFSPMDSATLPNLPLSFTANEVRDGGRTPNPFNSLESDAGGLEEGFSTTPEPTGTRKRRRTEKKRQWVWTIGQDDEEDGMARSGIGTSDPNNPAGLPHSTEVFATDIAEVRYLETPTPSVESASSVIESIDASMSDTGSINSTDDGGSESDAPGEFELDLKTPTAPPRTGTSATLQRDTPIPEICRKGDTPVPPELA
ncbi:hypothetical protein HIM_00268 [Hirsutella minnesotensis 3608]|nr:hypothetical protein HIM_00268 [Hirsutella minnesotensis 3608]